MILPIRLYPHVGLQQKSLPVPLDQINSDPVQQLIDDMIETMYSAFGIGLAAVQVGFLQRIIMVDVPGANPRARTQLHVLINPEIVATLTSTGNSPQREGCLSIPGVYEAVARPDYIKVRFYDRGGELREMEADGLLCRALDHEIEHLEGISVLDKVSRLKRNLGTKAMKVAKYPTTRSRYSRSDNPLVERALPPMSERLFLSSPANE